MLTLDCDPAVLVALKEAFPKPPNHAAQKLDKYLRLLEREMRKSLLRRSEYARKTNSYNIESTILTNKSPTLGNRKARVHGWLNNNGFGLLKKINKDRNNNIFGEISLLAPTEYLFMKGVCLLDDLRKLSLIELDSYLDILTPEWIDEITDDYSEYILLSESQKSNLYFISPIDIDSLKIYIRKILKGEVKLLRINEETYIEQAVYILRIAQFFNGVLPQKIVRKAFGRTYYEGVSVISVSKELRMAFLGESWEYDCKSCSAAWKMGFAGEWHQQKKKRRQTVREKFSAMTLYLEDKNEFFRQVIDHVFIQPSQKDYKKILKEAMTALGFGAKLGLGKWLGMNGEERQTSLFEVFDGDQECLARFVNCKLVKKFNDEQQILNKYIVAKFSTDAHWHMDMEQEQKRKKLNKPFSKAQQVVWLYQHAETIMMDIVRAELSALNKTVLANVHDAIVTRERLSTHDLQNIERNVRAKTNIFYFALGETGYERYQ